MDREEEMLAILQKGVIYSERANGMCEEMSRLSLFTSSDLVVFSKNKPNNVVVSIEEVFNKIVVTKLTPVHLMMTNSELVRDIGQYLHVIIQSLSYSFNSGQLFDDGLHTLSFITRRYGLQTLVCVYKAVKSVTFSPSGLIKEVCSC